MTPKREELILRGVAFLLADAAPIRSIEFSTECLGVSNEILKELAAPSDTPTPPPQGLSLTIDEEGELWTPDRHGIKTVPEPGEYWLVERVEDEAEANANNEAFQRDAHRGET